MNFIKARYFNFLREGALDIRYLILWFMVAVYPLVVVPRQMHIHFGGISLSLGYFTGPRYLILAVLSLLALIVLLKDKIRINHPVFIPLGIFLTFSLISTLIAPIPFTAWVGKTGRFTGFSTFFFCFILFILASNSKKTEKLLGYMIGSAAIVSFLAVLQYFGLDLFPYGPCKGSSHSYSTMGNPNFLGTYTAFILPASILFFLRYNKLPWLIFTGIIYAGLVVCQTRGAWIAFLAGFVIIGCHNYRFPNKRKSFTLVILVLLLVTGILLPFQNGTMINRVSSISGEVVSAVNFEDKAGSNRMHIWKESAKLLPDYWAFGMGPDHLVYAGIMANQHEVADKVHNIYLEIAVTMGVFAQMSYLAFFNFFLRLWRNEQGFIFFIMIFVYLVQGLFNIDVVMIMPLFWIVLGLSLANDVDITNGNSYKNVTLVLQKFNKSL